MDPAGGVRAGGLAEQVDECSQVVIGHLFPLRHLLGSGTSCGPGRLGDAVRHLSQRLPGFEGEGLHLLPHLELALLGPDPGHLGERVALDHLRDDGMAEDRGCPLSALGCPAMRTLTIDQARRFALGAQGFADPRPTGRVDVRHFRRVVDRIGLVQLDSVNVFSRTHYMPFFSRLGGYDRAALDAWLWGSGEMFEYWGHEASADPGPGPQPVAMADERRLQVGQSGTDQERASRVSRPRCSTRYASGDR